MTCHDALETMLALDNNEPPRPALVAHLAACDACSREWVRLQAATELLRLAETEEDDPALTSRIMESVRREPPPLGAISDPHLRMPFRRWLAAAALLLGGVLGLEYSESLDWLRVSFGSTIDLAMGLILGLFLTIFLCVLVGTNLKYVQRLFGVR